MEGRAVVVVGAVLAAVALVVAAAGAAAVVLVVVVVVDAIVVAVVDIAQSKKVANARMPDDSFQLAGKDSVYPPYCSCSRLPRSVHCYH